MTAVTDFAWAYVLIAVGGFAAAVVLGRVADRARSPGRGESNSA